MIKSIGIYSIATCYITAIAYGDESGLTEAESKLIERFYSDYLPEQYITFDWPEDIDSAANFQRDDISGLMADCVDVELFVDDSACLDENVKEYSNRQDIDSYS